MSCTLNQSTGTNSYCVTTYTGDKKNARGCKSSGIGLKRRNSTLRGTSCTCRVKFTLRIDHNSFFLVCGIGNNEHTGHPPLLSNEIRNRKRFLDVTTLETEAGNSNKNLDLQLDAPRDTFPRRVRNVSTPTCLFCVISLIPFF